MAGHREVTRFIHRRWLSLGGGVIVAMCVLTGCASSGPPAYTVAELSPLYLDDTVLTVEDVSQRIVTPDLLAMTPEMKDWVRAFGGKRTNEKQRLVNLHQSVKSESMLGMQYDPFGDGSAQEVFYRGTANCLAYANFFVAMAREAGLNARYQWLEVRPQWTRMGERVAVRLHVNVLVIMRDGQQYMVDIDPLQSRDITGSRTLKDAEGAALYHNNIAMTALAEEDIETAWLNGAKALQLSPEMGHLWVNMGAIYRVSDQHDAAEKSYFRALQLDSQDRSAMNNLVVLYEKMGRDEERNYWVERVERYRTSNPYYHAWLGDKAGEAGDIPLALEHYEKALALKPDDSRLLYSVGIIHFKLDDFDSATLYIERAIAQAQLRADVDTYRLHLEAVRREQLAAH
ncbi:MAG: transglutaminase domain-containing protein [Halioglobus sp.]